MSTFNSDHFQLEQAAPGTYIAFAKPTGHAISNAGIIDLGDRTIVFDTFLSPQAGRDLRAAAIAVTDRPPSFVANSHHHLDHIGGNGVFAGEAQLIASAGTDQLMATASQEEINDYQQNAATRLQQLEGKGKGNTARRQPIGEVLYYRAVLAALSDISLTRPTITYESKVVIRGQARSVELITFGGGHTKSDSILYVPDSSIIFTGDLLSIGYHPYLPDGDPGELDRILNQVIKLNPALLVPGHGAIAEINDIRVLRQYITAVTEMAMRELVYGATDAKDAENKANNMVPPPAFQNWDYATHFADNLKFLYRRLLAAYAD